MHQTRRRREADVDYFIWLAVGQKIDHNLKVLMQRNQMKLPEPCAAYDNIELHVCAAHRPAASLHSGGNESLCSEYFYRQPRTRCGSVLVCEGKRPAATSSRERIQISMRITVFRVRRTHRVSARVNRI